MAVYWWINGYILHHKIWSHVGLSALPQIRVCTINFCSLISHDKHLQLHQIIETYKPDVILGCESHVFPVEFLHPPPNRKDRETWKKGGVLIAVHSDIISVDQSSPADCEIVWTKISHNQGDIIFGSFYRQPTSPVETMEQLELTMNNRRNTSLCLGYSLQLYSGEPGVNP
jgi:hypothetical protein